MTEMAEAIEITEIQAALQKTIDTLASVEQQCELIVT